MPRRVYFSIGAVCALALLILLGALVLPTRPVEWAWWGAAFLLLSIFLGEVGAVEITRESDQAAYVVSVATIPHLAAALLLPAWVAMVLAGTSMLSDELRKRSPWPRLYWLLAGVFPGAISQLTLRYIASRNRKAANLSALDQLGRQLCLGLSMEQVFTAPVSTSVESARWTAAF